MFFYNKHKHDRDKMAEFNFDHIIDGIYIGNNMCCTAGLHEKLTMEGIKVNITLEEENNEKAEGVDALIWVPVIDGLTPSETEMRFLAKSMKGFVDAGKKIFVHCQKGHGRSGSVVMAYLLLERGMGFDEAFNTIKKQRDDIHLNTTQVANLEKLIK